MTKKQFQDGDKVPSWKDASGNANHLHAESISTQPVYRESVMSEAERLAEWLEEKAHNHAQDDIVEWSRMVETAALLRAQSARIAALEEALSFYACESNWVSSGFFMSMKYRASPAELDWGNKARLVLGKGASDA